MRWLAASVKTFLVLLSAGVLVFGSAHAASTIVTAMVCSSTGGSVITLYQPISDSTVNVADVNVNGKVTRATTLSIAVDGVLRQSINLSSLDATFDTTVTLAEGTHDIKLTATDICNVSDGTVSAIVTYNKAAVPSVGVNVPTTTGSTAGPASVANQTAFDATATKGAAPNQLQPAPTNDVNYGNGLVRGVVDDSQPAKPISSTPVIVAVPFIVGAGAFGWIHFRRFGH